MRGGWQALLGVLSTVSASGLDEAVSLVQWPQFEQPRSTRPLNFAHAGAVHSLERSQDDQRRLLEGVSKEQLLNVWDVAHRIGLSENRTDQERGLLLLQEAGRILDRANWPDTTAWTEWLKEGKSEGVNCHSARATVLASLGGVTASIAISTQCENGSEKVKVCSADSIDVLRAFLGGASQAINAASYCAKTIKASRLCEGGLAWLASDIAGMGHSSAALSYKCGGKYYEKDVDTEGLTHVSYGQKVFGVDALKFKCYFDVSKASTYLVMAILSFFDFYAKIGEDYVTESAKVRAFQGLSSLSWVVSLIQTMGAGCKKFHRKELCSAEAAELVGYLFDFAAGVERARDYCLDVYNKNELREGSTEDNWLDILNAKKTFAAIKGRIQGRRKSGVQADLEDTNKDGTIDSSEVDPDGKPGDDFLTIGFDDKPVDVSDVLPDLGDVTPAIEHVISEVPVPVKGAPIIGDDDDDDKQSADDGSFLDDDEIGDPEFALKPDSDLDNLVSEVLGKDDDEDVDVNAPPKAGDDDDQETGVAARDFLD